MDGRGSTGRKGEELACRYLSEHGHAVLERNWRTGHLEVDIISLASDGIHFVEVKSRKAPVQAAPEENVDLRKQRHIAAAARKYVAIHGSACEVFFDVVSVTFYGEEGVVEYFPSAYVPIYV